MVMEKRFTISQLAKEARIGIETIRFYHRQKLLDIPQASLGKIRYYEVKSLEIIKFIKSAQAVGFSLSEIKPMLKLKLTPKSECEPIKIQTRKKITEVEFKISELKKILKVLKNFEQKCDGHEPTEKCSILDGLKELKRG